MLTSSIVTYADNAEYTMYFTLNNYIPNKGYLRIDLPVEVSLQSRPTVTMKSGLTASLESYQKNYIRLKATAQIATGDYWVKWNRNKNPRSFAPTGLFNMTSYDTTGTNVIGFGQVSNIRMTEAGAFTSLRVEPTNSTNGLKTNYTVTFST
jgi:hypothetical protein